MSEQKKTDGDIVVYVCANCIPREGRLTRQWDQRGLRVRVHAIPCSGKIDAQYLFHAFEGGACAVCVIACPRGACQLAQGNYRAEIRVRTAQRLLAEIGLEPERIVLAHASANDSVEHVEKLARDAVDRLAALGKTPLRATA